MTLDIFILAYSLETLLRTGISIPEGAAGPCWHFSSWAGVVYVHSLSPPPVRWHAYTFLLTSRSVNFLSIWRLQTIIEHQAGYFPHARSDVVRPHLAPPGSFGSQRGVRLRLGPHLLARTEPVSGHHLRDAGDQHPGPARVSRRYRHDRRSEILVKDDDHGEL